MHCYICDVMIEGFKLDSRDKKIRPCTDCEREAVEAVQEMEAEAFTSFKDLLIFDTPEDTDDMTDG